jgi:hypothetical protein
MKKNKPPALGQKIPAAVKAFSRQEIESGQFSAKHSSILRILTKWAGYLEDIFENAEEIIKKKPYPFKNIHNELSTIENTP